MRIIDASRAPSDQQAPLSNVVVIDGMYKRRPVRLADDGAIARLADVRVINSTDQCGAIFGASHQFATGGAVACFARIEVENFETSGFTRTLAEHMDHLRIEGSVIPHRPVDVLIRNVRLTNSPGEPGSLNAGIQGLHAEGGYFGDILIDGLRIENVSGQSSIDLKSGGGVRSLKIINSPGLLLFLQGKDWAGVPVTIGPDVDLKMSMGADPDVTVIEDAPCDAPPAKPPKQPEFAIVLKEWLTIPWTRRRALLVKVGIVPPDVAPKGVVKERALLVTVKNAKKLGELWKFMQAGKSSAGRAE